MIWAELLSEEFLYFFSFLFYQFLVFNSRSTLKTKKTTGRFHAELSRKNFLFYIFFFFPASLSLHVSLLSHTETFCDFLSSFSLLNGSSNISALASFISWTNYMLQQEIFSNNKTLSLCRRLGGIKRKWEKKMLLALLACCCLSVCLRFSDASNKIRRQKWMSNDFFLFFSCADRESIDSFDKTFTFNLLNCIENSCCASQAVLLSLFVHNFISTTFIGSFRLVDWYVFDDIIFLSLVNSTIAFNTNKPSTDCKLFLVEAKPVW